MMGAKGKKEVKAGMGYTVGNILIKGINFITLSIFSRLLNTSQFGVYNTYNAYAGIIAIFLGLGLYASIKNAKFDFPDKVDRYVATLLWITLVPLAIGVLLILLFERQLTSLIGLPQIFLFLLLLQSYGSAMLGISNSRLALDYNYKKYLGFAGFNTIVNIGLSILLILTVCNVHREYGRIIGSAVPLILIGIFVFITYGREGGFAFDKHMADYGLHVGIPLIGHYLSQQIQSQFDRIAITKIAGASYTGIYSFSYSIASILQVIFYSTDNVWSVWFFEQMSKQNYETIRNVCRKYMTLIMSVAVMMLVGSREVIMIMGDREYWVGATIFVPMLIGIFLLFLYTIPVGIEYYFKKTKYIAMMTAVAAAVNIVLNFALIPKYGYIAAAYTTLISYAIQFWAHWFISRRVMKKEGIEKIYVLSDIMIIFGIVCVWGIIVQFTNPYPIVKYSAAIVFFAVMGYKYEDDLKTMIAFRKQK